MAGVHVVTDSSCDLADEVEGLNVEIVPLTIRFGDDEFTEVSDIIAQALQPGADVDALRTRVTALAADFPLYEGLESW